MIRNKSVRLTLCFVGLSIVIGATGAWHMLKKPKIEGTYKFVMRELPDGTKLEYPNIAGMLTYTKKHRNFNIYWKDDQGRAISIGYIADYDLSESTYEEKCLYTVVNDEINGKGVTYDLSGQQGSAPVTIDGEKITIPLPLYNEPEVVFTKKTLTATRAGEFVDHWEKVK